MSQEAVVPMEVVRCKLRCVSKTPNKHALPDGTIVDAYTIRFIAMYEVDEGKRLAGENIIFGHATPNAQATYYIVEPRASAAYEVGRDYYFTTSVVPIIQDESEPKL